MNVLLAVHTFRLGCKRFVKENFNIFLKKFWFNLQHQAIQFMLADMAIGVESARLTVLRAACQIDKVIAQRLKHLLHLRSCLLTLHEESKRHNFSF